MSQDDPAPASLADALPKEITRVRGIQDIYKSFRGQPNVFVEPMIQIMEQELQQAIAACAAGDVVQMLRSYKVLKDYEA